MCPCFLLGLELLLVAVDDRASDTSHNSSLAEADGVSGFVTCRARFARGVVSKSDIVAVRFRKWSSGDFDTKQSLGTKLE